MDLACVRPSEMAPSRPRGRSSGRKGSPGTWDTFAFLLYVCAFRVRGVVWMCVPVGTQTNTA